MGFESERSVTGQVVFFYYPDLKEAETFYGSIMGFQETFGLDWVKIYRTNEGASIGIVDEKKGFLKGAQDEDKPVMVSWQTDDVDGWHQYLKEKGIKILSPPEDSPETGIRGFVFADPGGYALEFFTWTLELLHC
jgi:predicted enzyme related to lactoylglutathione lyase